MGGRLTTTDTTKLLDSKSITGNHKSESTSNLPENQESTIRLEASNVLSAWKDVLVLSSGAFCYNFGYVAFLFNLSTLYSDGNLAFTTLSLVCGAQALASLFLPALLVRKWGCKNTAVVSVCCVIPFSAAQFLPGFFTFVPTSILLGIGNTCLWVAVGTYVSNVGLELAMVQNKRPDVVLSTLFGIVNLIRFGGAAAGNLVPYFLLTPPEQEEIVNTTDDSFSPFCGASYCSEPMDKWTPKVNHSLHEVVEQDLLMERTAVFAAFLGVGVVGPILLLVFLNPRRYFEDKWELTNISVGQLMMATIYAMKDPKHLLLMTTFVNAGIMRSFASGDFSKGFVMCVLGLKDVSLAAIVSNISYVGGTSLISLLVRATSVGGALSIINIFYSLTLLGLLIWTPHLSISPLILFLIASGIMGVTMGAYNNLNNTSIGLMFPENKEASYAAYRFHFSLGSLVGYAWAVGVCMAVKLWVLIAITVIGQVTYIALEYLLRSNRLTIKSMP